MCCDGLLAQLTNSNGSITALRPEPGGPEGDVMEPFPCSFQLQDEEEEDGLVWAIMGGSDGTGVQFTLGGMEGQGGFILC